MFSLFFLWIFSLPCCRLNDNNNDRVSIWYFCDFSTWRGKKNENEKMKEETNGVFFLCVCVCELRRAVFIAQSPLSIILPSRVICTIRLLGKKEKEKKKKSSYETMWWRPTTVHFFFFLPHSEFISPKSIFISTEYNNLKKWRQQVISSFDSL